MVVDDIAFDFLTEEEELKASREAEDLYPTNPNY